MLFVAFIRGNGVKLGPSQLPDIHRRVVRIAADLGFRETPDAYVVQAGGTLNAMAARMLGRNFIVLYSDLIEACEGNDEAIDFIVAHELGHLRAGHLAFNWLLLPGHLLPFLGAAYSRACEYTADRYGISVAADRARALDGLVVLAAGGRLAAQVDRRALVDQQRDLHGPLMRIAHWMSTHPPIPARLAALDAGLETHSVNYWPSAFAAWAVLLSAVLLPTLVVAVAMPYLGPAIATYFEQFDPARQGAGQDMAYAEGSSAAGAASPGEAERTATDAILKLVSVVEGYRARHQGLLPVDQQELYALWEQERSLEAAPMDPWSGERFGYATVDEGRHYFVYTAGPDGFLANDDTPSADDLYYSSAEAAAKASSP
ncbi:MAG TPA: hypothetical protein DCY89_05845 [Gammaproteobacteria bacterium]|nr:hypothetical protein [Gammaproteobacteria bacterium]